MKRLVHVVFKTRAERTLLGIACVLLVLVLVGAGCRPRETMPPPSREQHPLPASRPAVEFTSKAHGVRLSYPADWSPAPSDEFVLKLTTRDSDAVLSLDVPKLPPHVPGLIPLGMVVNGYVDDLKKKHEGIRVDEPEETSVAGAKARRVRSTWDDADASFIEDAVLTVHGDRVYLFRANADAATQDAARAVLDAVVGSVRWE